MPTYDLKLDCCGDDFAVFAGPGYHSGTALCNDTRVEGCDNLFRVKVSCLPYCPHPDWNGPGYYCVSTDPTCPTGSRVCVYYGAAPTACDTLHICGGPYNTKAECEFHCNPGTGTGTAPQISAPCPYPDPPHTGCSGSFPVPDVLYWTMTRTPVGCPDLTPRSGVLIRQVVKNCDTLTDNCLWLDPNRGPYVPGSNAFGADPAPYHLGVIGCAAACNVSAFTYNQESLPPAPKCLRTAVGSPGAAGCTLSAGFPSSGPPFTCIPFFFRTVFLGAGTAFASCSGCPAPTSSESEGYEITVTG